ncbi:MAG: DUF4112 domain-containing protein [Chthoniobacteraceae bacterium]
MAERERVREIEVEVLPPGEDIPSRSGKRERVEDWPIPIPTANPDESRVNDPFIALMARMMDTLFNVPGTRIRLGLDPLIGLIPGIGDTATAVTSLMLILKSARYGLPRIVIARMILNVLINSGVGAIPVVGDVFSVWFHSNARNYELLQKHARPIRASTRPDWVFVVGMVVLTLGLLALVFLGAVAWFQIFVYLINKI